MSTMSSSSTCSVTALAASTIPVADSTSPAPIDRLRQQERGHSSLRDRDGAQDNNTSSEIFGDITGTRVTKLFISSDAYTRKLAQQQWESQRQLRAEASTTAPHTSTQFAEFRMLEYDTSAEKGRAQENPNAGVRNPRCRDN